MKVPAFLPKWHWKAVDVRRICAPAGCRCRSSWFDWYARVAGKFDNTNKGYVSLGLLQIVLAPFWFRDRFLGVLNSTKVRCGVRIDAFCTTISVLLLPWVMILGDEFNERY